MYALGIALSVVVGISLGFFGGGGSILTVPLMVYVFGLEPKAAIASSLLVVGIASLFGALQHWRAGNVRLREAAVFGVAGMAGAYAGGRLGAFLDGGLLLLLFAAMMALTATAMLRRRREPPASGAVAVQASAWKLVLQGLAVGGFTGLVGAGGGFLIVPALALWAGLPMQAAVGTSLAIIVLNTASGFLGTTHHVRVDAALVAAVAVCAVAGSFVGSRLAAQVEPASLRRAFGVFVMAMAGFILVREGALVASTLSPALPSTGPQLAFALAMLGVGLLAGRSSRRASRTHAELALHEGAGI